MKKYSCFVISTIGEENSQIRKDADFLLNYIIKPALEIFDIEVRRGDHFITDERIGDSVIHNVQNADICICDISVDNANVYYELGRRDETGMPILLLKRKATGTETKRIPVDIADRRYIEYDVMDIISVHNAQQAIRAFVQPFIENGELGRRVEGATLSGIAEIVSRVERKIDRLATSGRSVGIGAEQHTPAPDASDGDPLDAFKVALVQRNIPAAEAAMFQLQPRYNWVKFYDYVVEQVASMGSEIAGQMLIDKAPEFFDESTVTYKQKTEYLGCLVSNANRRDTEEEVEDLICSLCENLIATQEEAEDDKYRAQPYNQLNRLYYGLYANTKDMAYLDKAIAALQQGLTIIRINFLYYNLSMCLHARATQCGDKEDDYAAKEAIDECLRLDRETEKEDADHLEMAYKIYRGLGDPNIEDIWEELSRIDPNKAFLVRRK